MKKPYEKTYASLLAMLVTFLSMSTVSAQNLMVSGKVSDSSGPVPGAAVMIDGTSIGVVSAQDGSYTIAGVPGDGILVFSSIGYVTQRIPVEGRSTIDVLMREDSEMLEEVVVIGYGSIRKSDLTGSVVSVKADEVLRITPTGNISDVLQGRMAGVSVISGSGNPAADNTIRVRGMNSVSAETGPLVVIDGFIGGTLMTLNPSDIASIEVLKDASATAIYGSRGANGVILVTTRMPGTGSIKVGFNGFTNIKTVARYPNTLSPYDYALLANQFAKEYFGVEDDYYYYDSKDLEAYKNKTKGYDYSRAIFRDPAIVQNYELSLSGGNARTSFLSSLRSEQNQGVIQGSDYSNYSWRLKVDTQIKKWLSAGLNFHGSFSTYTNPRRITAFDGLIQQATYFPPTIRPQNWKGEYNNYFIDGTGSYNPMGMIWENNTKTQTFRQYLQGYVNFRLMEGLDFRSQLGVSFSDGLTLTAENEKGYAYFKDPTGAQASASSSFNFSWLNINTLSYVKEFNPNHRVNAVAVFEQSYADTYSHSGLAKKVDFIDFLGYNALDWSDQTLSTVSSSYAINTMMSALLRVNYVLMNRYMITASIRADGSSRLSEKWSYFPSAAFAWNIKEEDFLRTSNSISQLKLRLGYGSVGNQAVPAYRIFSMMSPTTNADGSTSYVVSRPRANYLRWEINEQVNLGIDAGFLGDRITLTADWYRKLSKDILLETAQPAHMGYTSLLANSGELKNTGVEISIGATPVSTRDFSWHTDLTLTHNKGIFNKIPTEDGRQKQAPGSASYDFFYMIQGEKMGSIYGYTSDGVWQEEEVQEIFVNADGESTGRTNGQVYGVKPGNTKILDLNKDGKLNEEDQRIIGCGQPMFNWGLNNSFYWRDFDLSLFIIGFHGFDIYNVTRQCGFYNTVTGQNMCILPNNADLLHRWTKDNPDSKIPGFVSGGTEHKFFHSSFLEKGGFVKVKNITLGWTLPRNVSQKIGIDRLRIYASLQNPFIFTNYSGLDPEATLGTPLRPGVDLGTYPNSRNYMLGLNISL